MAAGHYAYLLSLPLVLHIPTLHTFVVHAGLLPLDPNRSVTSGRQPLAHIPAPPSVSTEAASNKNISVLRRAQEAAILTDIPQNIDPWVVLNMRSIRSDNSVTKYVALTSTRFVAVVLIFCIDIFTEAIIKGIRGQTSGIR